MTGSSTYTRPNAMSDMAKKSTRQTKPRLFLFFLGKTKVQKCGHTSRVQQKIRLTLQHKIAPSGMKLPALRTRWIPRPPPLKTDRDTAVVEKVWGALIDATSAAS